MIILGPIFRGIVSFGQAVLWLYFWVIIIRIILSWVSPDPFNQFVRIVSMITDPVFSKTRQLLPFLRIGMLDLSPLAILIAIQVLMDILNNIRHLIPSSAASGVGLF